MKITQSKINALYPLFKGLKLSSVEDSELVKVWHNLKLLRPLFQEYQTSVEEFRKTLQDSKFEEMQARVVKAQEREAKVKEGSYQMTPEDIKDVTEINEYFNELNSKGQEYLSELDNQEFDLDLQLLSMASIVPALKASELKFEDLESIDFIFE